MSSPKEKIEWEEVGNGDWRGKVGGRILVVIVSYFRNTKFYVWLFSDGDAEVVVSLEEAKAKAEELLAEWLDKAGLSWQSGA